jgi:diguanylate cyclase (GGDEF)-like protein
MAKQLQALIVEDSEDDTLLLVEELRRGGYAPTFQRVETAETMQTELLGHKWDIVFSDFTMPRFTAFDALAQLRRSGLDLPFIIVSGTIGEDRAVMAMKAGAHDYVLKGNLKRLIPAVDRELREAQIRRERTEAERTVRYLAYHDPLTDLPNRIRFQDEAQAAIEASRRDQRSMAMVLMDLERFKEVNDTLGHRHGDNLLRQVGLRLRSALRETTIVARLGGDEFGVLIPHLDEDDNIKSVVRQIIDMLEAPIMVEGVPVAVEASIGVALVPEHATDADTLMQRAEMAMYRAKQLGSPYSVYSPDLDSYSPQRLALMAELRDAIQRDQLVLYFQPLIDLKSSKTVGAEALVRWQHPKDGLIMPDRFIGSAEHTSLMKPLTHWVLANALEQCHSWNREHDALRVSVNLSARSLHDTRLPEQVAELLRTAKMDPDRLKLEITESALIAEPARAIDVLNALHAMGVKLSIDDFGTGYTSLNYIRRLPVHEIKIDKSFVLNMLNDHSDAAIVRSVIDLGHNLGLTVVAEGVENAEILERLRALGCDYAQGYHISRPAPAKAFAKFLNR